MKTLDISSNDALQNILKVLIDDLNTGRNTENAGWRLPKEFNLRPSTEETLIRLKLLQKNSKGEIRLNFENYSILRRLKENFKLDKLEINQLEYLRNIREDNARLERAFIIIDQVIELLSKMRENWKFVIIMGWWKMLELSGMPARVDDVLKKGFSPEDWTIKAVRSSPFLALEIAQNYGEISKPEDCEVFLTKCKIPTQSVLSYTPPNEHDIEKIKMVLNWKEVKDFLDEVLIKAVAFLGFSFFALKNANLFPHSNENTTKLYEKEWNVLGKLLDKSQRELLRGIEQKIDLLDEKGDEKGITWVSEILRILEVI